MGWPKREVLEMKVCVLNYLHCEQSLLLCDSFEAFFHELQNDFKCNVCGAWHLKSFEVHGKMPQMNCAQALCKMKTTQNVCFHLDHGNPGCSPLWNVAWVTELLVMNHNADEVSGNVDLAEENGFVFVQMPMFVNCPGEHMKCFTRSSLS